jgi:dimethylsulfone monooxygenase
MNLHTSKFRVFATSGPASMQRCLGSCAISVSRRRDQWRAQGASNALPGISLEQTADHINTVQALARQAGREIDVYTVGVVTCRPTTREAQDYYRHAVIDNADWAAVDNILAMRNITPQKHSPEEFQRLRNHQANGMGGLPFVGDPDSVARDIAPLAGLGLKGIAVSFVNYLDELPYFCAEVLPRLARSGLRDSREAGRHSPP